MMEHLRPTEYQKNEMLEKAFSGIIKKPKRSFRLKYCIIAATAVLLFSGTTVFADEIKAVFYNLLGKNELVSEDVLNEVYSDDDGHVKITVKEFLSDRINSYAIIEYTALDDKGKKWIDKALIVENMDAMTQHMNYPDMFPNFKDNNTALYGVNYNHGAEELIEYHTENSRVFKVVCLASGGDFGTNSMKLLYNLPDKWKTEATIDISESVQITDIEIDNSLAPDKYYKPLGIRISPLSLLIYGEDLGIVESGVNQSGNWYQKIVHDENIDSLYLIMKDGKKYNILDYSLDDSSIMLNSTAMLTHVSNPEVEHDIIIYTSAFEEPIDLELIDGIELDGVYYPIDNNELQ